MASWRDYQEEAAAFFRRLGLAAETDVRLPGVRTPHDIDVVVKVAHAGFEFTWLVECKQWKSRVGKEQVMALRQIVSDLGADRGILLSESGYQSGALEAANLTNVKLTSLAELRESTKLEIAAARLRELFDRVETCSERYWDIPKPERIEMGLRPDSLEFGYSGDHIVAYCRDVLSQSMRGRYPFEVDNIQALAYKLPIKFSDPDEVVAVVDALISELEGKLGKR